MEGTLSSDNGVAINIAQGGTLMGVIRNEGTIDGGIEIYGTHISRGKGYIGSGNLIGGYTVMDGGVAISTGDHTVYTGNGFTTNKITVLEGAELKNEGIGTSAIYVDTGGTVGSDAGTSAIEIGGTVSADGDDTAIVVASGATILGTLDNTGVITGGIEIAGTHTSSSKTFNNTGSLTGGYTILGGANVTSTGDHTLYTGNSGVTDKISVAFEGQLTSTGTESSAIYVNNGGTLGSTADAVAIEVAGTVSSTDDTFAINVAEGGTVTGSVVVQNNGSVTNGMSISGAHSAENDAIRIETGGQLGNNAAGNAIEVTATGSPGIDRGECHQCCRWKPYRYDPQPGGYYR